MNFEDTSVIGLWLVMGLLGLGLLITAAPRGLTMSSQVYAITVTRPDGSTYLHSRCFAHELAARAEAEGLAEGAIGWLSTRYGMDEYGTEYEVQRLSLWRLGDEKGISSHRATKPPSSSQGSYGPERSIDNRYSSEIAQPKPGKDVDNRHSFCLSPQPGRLDDS